jgi:hypothetical protein
MKITIHRGLNQIGGCITEIQSLSGSKYCLVDTGMKFLQLYFVRSSLLFYWHTPQATGALGVLGSPEA